ncbi:hypothetical protein [Methyloferula stellata]|jgi:hypothetical protein|uniref:hypothetical protein n=1 Tax=Methyloferula stellata TaxID=876270 RepID=UPI000371B0EC|nr:hypothetical protein [Methyloferula stellata]
MLIDELVHTCANEEVAKAAVFSLGLPFAGKVASAVQFRDQSIGAFVAQAVCRFAATAKDDERRSLLAAMTGKDQPLLAGLHFILVPVLEDEARAIGHAAAAHALGRPIITAQLEA